MRGWSSMTSAKPKSRRGRSGSCADRLAGSGSGGDVGSDGVGSSVGWLLLSALVGQPGGGQERAEPGLGAAVGESTKDVAEVLEGRRANQIAVDDESMQNREPAGTVVGAGKQEIPAPDGGTALLALDMGVGQRDPRIVGSSRKMMRVDHWLTAYVTALPSGLLGVARPARSPMTRWRRSMSGRLSRWRRRRSSSRSTPSARAWDSTA